MSDPNASKVYNLRPRVPVNVSGDPNSAKPRHNKRDNVSSTDGRPQVISHRAKYKIKRVKVKEKRDKSKQKNRKSKITVTDNSGKSNLTVKNYANNKKVKGVRVQDLKKKDRDIKYNKKGVRSKLTVSNHTSKMKAGKKIQANISGDPISNKSKQSKGKSDNRKSKKQRGKSKLKVKNNAPKTTSGNMKRKKAKNDRFKKDRDGKKNYVNQTVSANMEARCTKVKDDRFKEGLTSYQDETNSVEQTRTVCNTEPDFHNKSMDISVSMLPSNNDGATQNIEPIMKTFRHTEFDLNQLVECPKYLKERYVRGMSNSLNCQRFCYHNGYFYWTGDSPLCIDVLNEDLDFVRRILLQGHSVNAMHPLTDDHLLLATNIGLYSINVNTGQVGQQIRQGFILDVHVNDGIIAALTQIFSIQGSNNLIYLLHTGRSDITPAHFVVPTNSNMIHNNLLGNQAIRESSSAVFPNALAFTSGNVNSTFESITSNNEFEPTTSNKNPIETRNAFASTSKENLAQVNNAFESSTKVTLTGADSMKLPTKSNSQSESICKRLCGYITLKHDNVFSNLLHNNNIYVSTSHKELSYILKYNLTGNLLTQFEPSALFIQCHPLGWANFLRICSIDKNGSLLIADYHNHRILLLHPDGSWSGLLISSIKYPTDAVVVGDLLYVKYQGSLTESEKPTISVYELK